MTMTATGLLWFVAIIAVAIIDHCVAIMAVIVEPYLLRAFVS